MVITILTFPFMWLWNALMPMIFGLCKLTFFQSLGLLILCNIVFGGIKFSKK